MVTVDDREVDVRVGLGRHLGGVGQIESDGDDEVAALIDEVVDVGAVVGGRRGLDGAWLDAELFGCFGQALEPELVERLVVESATVGDHAGQEVTRSASARSFVFGGRSTACDQGDGTERRDAAECCLPRTRAGNE